MVNGVQEFFDKAQVPQWHIGTTDIRYIKYLSVEWPLGVAQYLAHIYIALIDENIYKNFWKGTRGTLAHPI